MAKDIKKVAIIVNRLKDTVTCILCTRLLTNATRTTCGHTFCRGCIIGSIESRPKGQKSIPCPNCPKALTKASLKSDDKLASIVEIVESLDKIYAESDESSESESESESGSESQTESEEECSSQAMAVPGTKSKDPPLMESKQVQTDSEGNVLTVMTQLLHGLAVAETVEGFFFIQGLGRVDVKFKKPRSSQTVDMEVGTSPPSERRGKKRRSDQSDQESEDESHPTQAMASLNRSKTKKTEKTGVKLNAKDFIQNLQDQNLDTKSVSQMDIETKSVLSVDPETGRKTEEEATFGSQDLSHIQNSHAFNGIGTRGSSLGDVLVPETESLDKEQVREALEDLSFVAVEETVVS